MTANCKWRLEERSEWRHEEQKAAYGWTLMETAMEVECGSEKIQAMSSLQAKAKAILLSLKIVLQRYLIT